MPKFSREVDGHRVTIEVSKRSVVITETHIDPEEGENAVVGRVELSNDELEWAYEQAIVE